MRTKEKGDWMTKKKTALMLSGAMVLLLALIVMLVAFIAGRGHKEPVNTQAELVHIGYEVVGCIRDRDYDQLANYVSPTKGVTFTPYSTVSEQNVHFTAKQIKSFGRDTAIYIWGVSDGVGKTIECTPQEYVEDYVYRRNYLSAPLIGVDRVVMSGNAVENVAEYYPGCHFIDFHFPGDEKNEGMDWSTLRIVLEQDGENYYVVGIINSQWTI